jgi:two-component system NarL family response regulator
MTMTKTKPDESSAPIRILLVEDNFLTRVGTVTVLGTQPDFQVVGEAEDGPRALAAYSTLRPDVAVVDLKLPGYDGVQLISAILAKDPGARILVLTYYDGDENIFRALKAGALGYLTKDVHGSELFAAIRTVASGAKYLPATIAGRLSDRMFQAALSARELQVLQHLFEGRSNRDIAEQLSLAEKTVIMYVSKILAKLGAKSRSEAVAIAIRRGILRV